MTFGRAMISEACAVDWGVSAAMAVFPALLAASPIFIHGGESPRCGILQRVFFDWGAA